MSVKEINQAMKFLQKAINYLENVSLWSKKFHEVGDSPSEIIGIVGIYYKELIKQIKQHQKTINKPSWQKVNIWIGKIIFLRLCIKKVDFGAKSSVKEQSLREIAIAEKVLWELRKRLATS